MTSNPRSKNKLARSASERAKTIPRDKYGKFVKGTTIIIDEYGDPGLTKMTSTGCLLRTGRCHVRNVRDTGITRSILASNNMIFNDFLKYDEWSVHSKHTGKSLT